MTRGAAGFAGGQVIDATTGLAFVGTVSAYITLDGGTQTIATTNSGVCTSEGNGYYTIALTSAETNGELVAVTFTGSGCIPATVQFLTTAAVPTPAPIQSITGPGVTTALTLITDALEELNVFQPGESIDNASAQSAFRILNRLIGSWAQQALLIPAQIREAFDLVANQASYTIGPDGDFDTVRPPNQQSVTGVNLVLTASDPDVEIPLARLTDDGYRLLSVKGLDSGQPAAFYYNPTFTAMLGTLYLWPIPNVATNDIAIYTNRPLSTFADLTSTYAFPDGYGEALTYGLARRLAAPFGREVSPDLLDKAVQSLATIKRSNAKLSDLPNYFGSAGWYDFNSGSILVRH